MESKPSFEAKLLSSDLRFWKENLEREKQRLKGLFEFSKGVEHSATMDAKRNIKRYELKIAELEEKLPQEKPTWTMEEILRREG